MKSGAAKGWRSLLRSLRIVESLTHKRTLLPGLTNNTVLRRIFKRGSRLVELRVRHASVIELCDRMDLRSMLFVLELNNLLFSVGDPLSSFILSLFETQV